MPSPVPNVLATSGADPLSRNGKLSEAVAKRIVEDIAEQGLTPGSRLPPERLMLERFGVSRGTLREALRILEVHGLLVIRSGPRGGPVIASMTAAHFAKACSLHFNAARITGAQLWQARGELEPTLALLAATGPSDEARQGLAQLIEAAGQAELSEAGAYQRLSSAFHEAIAQAAGNPILSLLARSLAEMTAHLESGAIFPAEDRARITDDHVRIAEVILAGDSLLAQRLMAAHMTETVDTHAQRYPGLLNAVLPYVI
jgi:GntR family transcriptional repressor for pyruvate dehydrogenase complex